MKPESEAGPGAPAPTARLFFALWPPAAVAGRLHAVAVDAAQTFGGRLMRAETLHLTLAFLGEVSLGKLDELGAIGAGIDLPVAALCLDRLGWWRHNHVLWAGVSEARVPETLHALASTLAGRLSEAGFRLESRVFLPHVTLLRKAGVGQPSETDLVARLPALGELVWPVRDFVLVRSLPSTAGADYRIVGRWPLPGQ
jgi:RNA 2',3'-cyclic 3'-phosphodiesterase